MAATGAEIASAYISLQVRAPGIGKDISKQLGGVDMPGLGSQMGSKLAKGMKTALKVGAVGAAAVLGTALTKGFGRLKAIEQAEAKMGAIGFTSKEVAGAMDNALNSVKGTAFGLGDAASVASQLMAANIKPGEELEGILKTVANNAALAGTNFDEMGSIFGKAATQANGVQNDVIGQLADKGIPIYKALGDQMGVTAGEVFKLASEGKVDFDTFAKAAEAAAGTAAEAMGNTTSGSFDNMMAALGRLGAKILEDIFPLIGPLFQDITKWLDEAMVHVEPVVDAFGDGLKNAIEGVKTGWQWMKDNSGWLAPIAIAVGAAASAFVLWNGAIKAWSALTAVAKGVQLAFNAVMAANPIMIVVMAVAALVAGILYWVTQTESGQAAWAAFTGFLSEAWANVSAFFQTVWETVLKPVFDGIATVATWLFENILLPQFKIVQGAFAILGGIFQGIWDFILKPVFEAIGAQFNWLWVNVISPVVTWIQQQWAILGLATRLMWETYIQPAFKAIGDALNWIWLNIISPVVGWIQEKWAILGLATQAMYERFIKPAWDAVAGVISSGWNTIKGVIDTMVRVIKTDPKLAFEAARDAIGTAWAGIQELAAKPVRFVVDTVINGLINTVNGILPEGMKIPTAKLPKGFSDGGYTGNLAPSAVAGIVHGNEHVIKAQSRAAIESRHPGVLDYMNQHGSIPGYRSGGLVNPLPQGSYSVSQAWGNAGHNGIDLAAPSGTKVFAAADGTVGLAGSVNMGGNEVYIQHANGLGTRYSHLSRFGTQAGAQVKAGNVIGYVGSTGMSTGPHLHYMVHNPGLGAGSYSPNVNPAPYMGIAGSDLGEAGGSAGILGGLVDWAVGQMKGAFPDGGMFIDVASALATSAAQKMAEAFNPFGANDVGTTLYDNGGWLQPGVSLVENKTGRPEPILTGSQWDDLKSGGGGLQPGDELTLVVGGERFPAYIDARADAAVDRGNDDMAAIGRRTY